MLFHIILVFTLSVSNFSIASEGCFTFPSETQQMHADKGQQLLSKIEDGLNSLPPKGSEDLSAIPTEKLILLKSNGELEKALSILSKKQSLMSFAFWHKLEEGLFTSLEMETKEFVKEVEEIFKLYRMEFDINPFGDLLKQLKRPKKAMAAKKKIIIELERMSLLMSQVYGREINLLDADDLLRFFDVTKRAELGTRLQELSSRNLALNARISSLLSEEGTSLDAGMQAWTLLRKHFNMEKETRFAKSYREFFENKHSFPAIKEIIEHLHLPPMSEAQYLKQLQDIMGSEELNLLGRQRASILLLYKAYFEAFPESEAIFAIGKLTQGMQYQQYLVMHSSSFTRHRLIENSNIKLDHLVEQIERLEANMAGVQNKVATLAKDNPNLSLDLEATIRDFPTDDLLDYSDDQLLALTKQIRAAEKKIDQIIETEVKRVGIENIKTFNGLNYKWERIRANHPYALEGSDYKAVVFHADVLAHFKQQEDLGSRFLAALSKSYVPHVNSSGLRVIGKIHSDFRDIKLLAKGGKTRIYGKLIGDTIHFFGIHNKDEAYKPAQMAKTIENFILP